MIALDAGTVIAGRYRLERSLAQGGMGSVWVGRHLQLDAEVAIKFMAPEYASSAEGRGRFEREARAAAQLRSPNVVQVYDYGVEEETPYIVMELLQGEDLEARVRRAGRLSLAEVQRVVDPVCRVLGLAHDKGLVHRDLKPGNIFLASQAGEQVVKVLDFGIAKALGPALAGNATRTGTLIGSPCYMSPEQMRRSKGVDHRSDLWSLGVIIYECVTGRLPFAATEFVDLVMEVCNGVPPPASRFAPDLPREVDRFLCRALSRDVSQRFQSAGELALELAAVAALAGAAAAPAGSGGARPASPEAAAAQGTIRMVPTGTLVSTSHTVVSPPSLPRRGRRASSFAGGILLLSILAGAFTTWQIARSREDATPTGDAKLDVLIGDLNQTFAPFQELSSKDATDLDKANAVIGGTLGLLTAPVTLLNDGFALLTKDIAKVFPPLPAATLGMLHLGIPHVHAHPPAMPIPLPSFGPVALSGCVSVLINGLPAARAGDMGISVLCGSFAPPFEVFTGSSKVFFGGARAARMLDITMHCMPGAAAGKALGALQKVMVAGGVALGVAGVGSQVLSAVAQSEKAKRLAEKKAQAEEIPPDVAAQMTAEELAEAKEEAAAQAAAEQQDINDEAAAAKASAKMTGIQAGLDAAALALGLIMGMDPGVPPCFGAVLSGHPNVLVGGFPMPPWLSVARGLGKLGRGLKKGTQKLKHRIDNTCFFGHPIDPVTGACVDELVDHEAIDGEPGAESAFRWVRHYTSAGAGRDGPMGRGFRHPYERSLTVDLDRAVYTDERGDVVEIPLPAPGQAPICRDGCALACRRQGEAMIYMLERGEQAMEFIRERRSGGAGLDMGAARFVRLFTGAAEVELVHDELGRLTGLLETSGAGKLETRLYLDEQGHILEVRRGPQGERSSPLIAAYGYDHAGCLVAFRDALGHRASHAYDRAGRMVRMTDRNGYSFHFRYDEQGRCVEEHGDDGLYRVSARYEPDRRRTIVAEHDGGEWIYEYDINDTIVCIKDPCGGERRRIVDAEGKVVREWGPDERSLEFVHDETGLQYGVIDDFGRLHPPLDDAPEPPDPPAHDVPATAVEQQWGPALEALPASLLPVDWLPATLPARSTPSRLRDAQGRVVEEVDGRGRRRAWAYDPAGNVVRYTDADGGVHRTVITSWNLPGATIDPLGHRMHHDYTARARIARIIDPGGGESRYEYDLKDRLVRVHRHGEVHEEYSYAEDGALFEKRDGAGQLLVQCSLGVHGWPVERRLSSGQVYRYAYDERGNTTIASTSDVRVERRFDGQGGLLRDERDGRGVRHAVDCGHQSTMTYLGRFNVVYRRALDGSLRVSPPAGGEHRIRRDEAGRVFVELAGGLSVLSSYDEEGRCHGRALRRARGDRGAQWSVAYTYSNEGDLARVADSVRGDTEYAYDAAHRLIGAAGPSGARVKVVLDEAGNVREKRGFCHVELLEGNRLRSAGRERFRYDGRHRLAEHVAEGGVTTRYHYDSADMLTGVSWEGRAEAWTAGYDGLGRRLFKAIGGARTDFYWDGDRLAAEVGPRGALRIYVYPGPEALVPLLFIDYDSVLSPPESGRPYYVVGDQLGVPLQIEDQAGNVVWWASHVDPYGEITVHPGASISCALRFPGHYFDEETGLHYNRHRYYSPRLARYLQPDPAGQSGGVNLYSYPASPLVDVDVMGLASCKKGRLQRRPPGNKYQLLDGFPGIAIKYNAHKNPFLKTIVTEALTKIAEAPTGRALLDEIAASRPAVRHDTSGLNYKGYSRFRFRSNHAPPPTVIITPSQMRHFSNKDVLVQVTHGEGGRVVDVNARRLDAQDPGDAIRLQERNNDPRHLRPEGGNSGATIHTAQDQAAAGDGRGSASTVSFNNTQVETSRGESAPPHITLAHELIHSLHSSRGVKLDGQEEEHSTVGLGDFPNQRIETGPRSESLFTENQIRQELGLPPRTQYGRAP